MRRACRRGDGRDIGRHGCRPRGDGSAGGGDRGGLDGADAGRGEPGPRGGVLVGAVQRPVSLVRDSKGLRYLDHLLRHPGSGVSGAGAGRCGRGPRRRVAGAARTRAHQADPSGGAETLDAQAVGPDEPGPRSTRSPSSRSADSGSAARARRAGPVERAAGRDQGDQGSHAEAGGRRRPSWAGTWTEPSVLMGLNVSAHAKTKLERARPCWKLWTSHRV